ncbi:2-C-methyl-D-erythritol 2 [Aspergillus terreus]|nr:2-C-methyl-D-erythritol 2 [Aspergillus terreus]
MRICVFQSCFEELQASVGDAQELRMNPGPFTTQHTVSHKTIHKATAREQIDQAVREGYDFYLNFMWGTHDDSLAGVDAIRYFESLNLPSAGVQSAERAQSKWDFFAEAKRVGSPLVPGTERFPLFVKPASGYGSMFIDRHSLCHNEAELRQCIERLNKSMRPVRIQRAQALGHPEPEKYADDCEAAGGDSTDIVVQEFIDGEEYSVVVIAMGERPAPLTPQRVKYKQISEDERFMTLDLKFDPESGYELLHESENPDLYRHLQETAVEAFTTKKMYTNYMGCDVDMRLGRDGRAYVIEVDPLPVFFYPTGSQLEDTDVKYGFPGSYRAVLNTYITNYFLKNPGRREGRFTELAALFDQYSLMPHSVIDVAGLGHYEGTALDLGCGTGAVGRALQIGSQNRITRLVGVDMSNGMLDVCRRNGLYSELVYDRMESFLARQTEMVDHIFCVSSLGFLPVEELDFVLVRCFQLAKQTITLVVEDNKGFVTGGNEQFGGWHDYWTNHSENIRTFQVPPGWHLCSPVEAALCHQGGCLYFRFLRMDKASGR